MIFDMSQKKKSHTIAAATFDLLPAKLLCQKFEVEAHSETKHIKTCMLVRFYSPQVHSAVHDIFWSS